MFGRLFKQFIPLFLLLLGPQIYAGQICAPASEVVVTYKQLGQTLVQKKQFNDQNLSAEGAYGQYRSYLASLAIGPKDLIEVRRESLVKCSEGMPRAAFRTFRSTSTPDLSLYVNNSAKECRTSSLGSGSIVLECSDGSSAIYHKGTDSAFIKPDTSNLYSNMEQQTQAMKALLNRLEVLSRESWKPTSRSITMGGADFDKTVDLIRSEANGGPVLKKPEDLVKQLTNFKMNSLNETLDKAFITQQDRLTKFAGINNASNMTKEQTAWYFDRYVQGLERLDDLQQKNTRSSHTELTNQLQDTLNDLVTIAPGKPYSREKRAAAQAVIDSFAPGGIIARPSNPSLDSALKELRFSTSMHDPSLSRREDAARVRQVFNGLSEVAAFGRSEKTSDYLTAMSWVKDADGLLGSAGSDLNQARGQRLLDQAELFTLFENGQRPPALQLTSSEISLFNVNPNTDTFAGYVLGNAIKGLAGTLGTQNNAYLYFHASTAVRQAQKEALYGNLSTFNAFIQSAYSVIDFAEGLGEGVISVAVGGVEGTIRGIEGAIQFFEHPIDSSVALYTAAINLEISKTIIMDAIKTKASESLTWGPREAGKFHGELLTSIVAAAYSAGHIIRGSAGADVAEKISSMAESIDFLPAMKGYRRLESVYPDIDSDLLEVVSKASPQILENFADASDEFLGVLGRKLENRQLTVGMASHIAMFKNGAARIVRTDRKAQLLASPFLTSAQGISQDIFVLPKDRLLSLLNEVGNDAALMEKRLGFSPGSLKNTDLSYVDIPMDWKFKPALPSGFEKAANEYFMWGGYTSGGLPELRMTDVPTGEIKIKDLGTFK